MLHIRRMQIFRETATLSICSFELEVRWYYDLETISIPISFKLHHAADWSLDGIQAKAVDELKALLRFMGERDRHGQLTAAARSSE